MRLTLKSKTSLSQSSIPATLLSGLMLIGLLLLTLRPVPGSPVAVIFPAATTHADRASVVASLELTLLDSRMEGRMLIVDGADDTDFDRLYSAGAAWVIGYHGLTGCAMRGGAET